MSNKDKVETNSNGWKVSQSEFKGFVKAKLEGLENTCDRLLDTFDNHIKSSEGRDKIINNSLTKCNEDIIRIKARSKMIGVIFGIIGAILLQVFIFLLGKV